MSGTGRGRGRVKRQEVEDGDGWTVITHGMGKMNVGDKKVIKEGGEKNGQLANGLPSKTVEGLTPTKLHQDFEKMQDQWKETAVAKQVSDLLGKTQRDVKEAVCIGIGSFSRDWEHRYRSMWQLVLFVHVARTFSKDGAQTQMYAQDPAFTDLDISFLKLLNIEATEHNAQDHISSNAFVFSPFVDWYILLPVFLKGKDPVLYIGNEIFDDYTAFARGEEKREKLKECNEVGKSFRSDRDCVKLKDFERHAHALNGMIIYTRKIEAESEHNPA